MSVFEKITNLIPAPERDHCDFTCFNMKPSEALIISDGERSAVLSHVGGYIDYWLNEGGITDAFDGVDPGVWIWQGKIIGHRDYQGEYDAELVGDFRRPTAEEWEQIRDEDYELWDADEWQACDHHQENEK